MTGGPIIWAAAELDTPGLRGTSTRTQPLRALLNLSLHVRKHAVSLARHNCTTKNSQIKFMLLHVNVIFMESTLLAAVLTFVSAPELRASAARAASGRTDGERV